MEDAVVRMRDAELAKVREEFDAWSGSPGPFDDHRITAIRTVMTALFEAGNAAEAERTWTLLRHVLVQRRNEDVGQTLERADACATDAYLGFMPAGGPAPPMVCLDAVESPETYLRSAFRAQGRSIPIPMVFVSPGYLSCPWLLTTIHHEIGHALDKDLRVTDILAPLVPVMLGTDDIGAPLWVRWLREIVCDAFALRISGPAYAWTMALIHDRLGLWGAWDEGGVHPPAAVRMPLLVAMLDAAGASRDLRGALAGLEAHVRRSTDRLMATARHFRDQMSAIAELVMNVEIPALGRSLSEAGPNFADDLQRIAVAGEALAKLDPAPARRLPVRLVPGAAQMAMLLAGPESSSKIASAAIECLHTADAPAWTSSPETWQALRERSRSMTATRLQGEERFKVPPTDLLRDHERISFVGATHHQLSRALSDASVLREGRRWRRLEIFFLSDGGLRGIGQEDGSDLRAKKTDAIRALLGRMEFATSWVMYEYDRPFYFASYWDVEAEQGRIHVSPYVWGEELKTCPAVDYIRGKAPTAAYCAYERGLAALRRTARIIDAHNGDEA